jgi:thimet oligopeptidase
MSTFDFINISLASIKSYEIEIISNVNTTMDQIINADKSFDNTIQPLINLTVKVYPYRRLLHYVSNFYTSEELRNAASQAETKINKFIIETYSRKDLYNACDYYYNNCFEKDLSYEEQRYVVKLMNKFRRKGLNLPEDKYMLVKQISKDLSDISVSYQNNINKDKTYLKHTKEELDGVPNYWFNDDKIIVENDIKYYKVTMKYPDYIPMMDYVNNEEIRKQIYKVFNSKCGKENDELLRKAIELRYKKASILGYATHADYKTAVNTIKNGTNAMNFLLDMNNKYTPLYDKDMKQLLDFAKNKSKNPTNKSKLDLWDLRYYSRELTEYECHIDMNDIRKYFPLEVVKNGLFDIYQRFLGLTFVEVPTTNKWHDDIKLYQVNDANELLGYFYFDLYPRDGKYNHAAVFPFIVGHDTTKINGKKERQPHIVTVACNFPKDGNIGFDDVKVFFHEFGHVMHQICSKPQLSKFAGFGVKGDFLECPSQFFENWIYTKKGLELISKHSETGEIISQELIDKLNKKRIFLSGVHYKKQLLLGVFDMKIHSLTELNDVNLQKIWYDTEKEVLGIDNEDKLYTYSSIGHFMNGYDAEYYGYLYSEVNSTNLFYKFFKDNDVLDSKIGIHYRKNLLEPGSTQNAMILLKNTLGEIPNNNYFLLDRGLN